MKNSFLAVALLSLVFCNVFATTKEDIVPTAKFGSVRLELPASPAIKFGDYVFSLNNLSTSKITEITAEKVSFKVHAGFEYSLQLKPSGITYVRNGFFVKDKEELVIRLAALTYDLDDTVLQTSFWNTGIVHVYSVNDKAQVQVPTYSRALLVAPGEYQFTLSNSDRVLDLQPYFPKKISLKPLDVSSISLTPPDERATIVVQFDKQSFPSEKSQTIRQSEIALQYTLAKTLEVEDYKTSPASGDRASRIPVEKPKEAYQLTYKVWANMKDRGRYELDVNNMRQILTVKPRETQTVKIHSLNVDHFDGKVPGFYRVALEKDTSDPAFFEWITCESSYCYPIHTDQSYLPSMNDLTDDKALYNGFFRTRTTHHVLDGYKYRVVPYAFDTLKVLKAQEPIVVDFTNK